MNCIKLEKYGGIPPYEIDENSMVINTEETIDYE